MEILPFPFHHLLLPPIFFPSLSSLSYRYLHLPPNIIFIQEGHPLRCCQPGGRAWTGQICPTGRHEQCTHSSTTGLAGRALPSLQKNRGSAGAGASAKEARQCRCGRNLSQREPSCCNSIAPPAFAFHLKQF